jgi:hypothetical protein
MLFKAKFNNSVSEEVVNSNDLEVDYNSVVGKEIIYFKNHEFELDRDGEGFICEITFCNQCVQTFDIEEIFIDLISQILATDETVILFDSNGSEEILTKDELLEMF